MQQERHTQSFPVSLRTLRLHIICWSIYIIYELYMLVLMKVRLEAPYVYAVFYAINISYFYGLSYSLSIAFDRDKKLSGKGLLSAAGLILVYISLKFIVNFWIAAPGMDFRTYLRGFPVSIPVIFYRAGYFTLLAIFVWAFEHIAHFRRKASEAEKQRMQVRAEKAELEIALMNARNAYLRQQINPHLLFNALNFTYSQVVATSPDAARCLILLTELLRFSLDTSGEDGVVNVSDEMTQINHLLEINQFRFGDAIHLAFETDGKFDRHTIIPLILLTLAENVFKHGNLTDNSSPALIRISITAEGELQFTSRNRIKSLPAAQRRAGSGLRNARIRLENAYTSKGFRLDHLTDGDIFTTNLRIILPEKAGGR